MEFLVILNSINDLLVAQVNLLLLWLNILLLLIDLLEQLEVVLNPVSLINSLDLLNKWLDVLLLADDLWLLLNRRNLLLKHLLSLELSNILILLLLLMEAKKWALSVDVWRWILLDGVEVHNLLSDHGIKDVL